MAERKGPYHRMDEAQAEAEKHGGTVVRDRLWWVEQDKDAAKMADPKAAREAARPKE